MQNIVWAILTIQLISCTTTTTEASSLAVVEITRKFLPLNCNESDPAQACPKMCTCCSENEGTDTERGSESSMHCIKSDGLEEFPTDFAENFETIVLEENNFRTLEHASSNNTNRTFKEYPTKFLSLKENEIETISETFFRGFLQLETLILRENDISALDWTIELENSKLQYLDLSYNKITKLANYSFGRLTNLQWLYLSHNSIGSIGPSSFNSLPLLSWLDLSQNDLEVETLYENSFVGLQNLTGLSLADNQKLTELPEFKTLGVSGMKLENLDLHGLPLVQSVPAEGFFGLKSLTTLNLSYCGLKELNLGWLDGGPQSSLETLDLSNNNFRKIRNYYFVVTDIGQFCSDLHASKNKRSLHKHRELINSKKESEFYQELPKLTWLSLSDNPNLSNFEENSFIFIPNLQYLFLQRCNLSRLNLPLSEVQYHEDAIRESFKLLRGIWIFGNPWHCDCHLRNVIDISASYDDSLDHNSSLIMTPCKNPRLSTEDDLLFVDDDEYYYKGHCHYVSLVEPAFCFRFTIDEKFCLFDVPRSYLRCPDEPIVLFIAVILGPISLLAAIILILMCGFCTVFVSRMHRSYIAMYNPKYYHLESRSKKLASPRSNLSQSFSPVRRSKAMPPHLNMVADQSSPRLERSSNKPHYQTNLVMKGFSASMRHNHNHSPAPLRPIPVFPRKTLPSPRVKRLGKRSSRHQTPANYGNFSRHPDVELETYSTKIDGHSTPTEWIHATPLSNSNSDINSTNSSKTSKSDTIETNIADTSNAIEHSAMNFLPIPPKSQSIPFINEPPVSKFSPEIDICQIKISESPTIPYIDEDTNIKLAIERYVYQDPVTKAVVPKNTQRLIEERSLLVAEDRDANANSLENPRQPFLKQSHLDLLDNERNYHSS